MAGLIAVRGILRRNEEGRRSQSEEGTRSRSREFVVDLYVLIKQIRVSDELIAPDLVLGVHETAVSLRIRKGERELVVIEFHLASWRK